MKRMVLIGAMVLQIATLQAVQAQVTLGISAGVTRTNASLTDELGIDVDTDARRGLAFGMAAEFGLTPHLGLLIGANYAEGGSIFTPAQGGSADLDLGVTFLELPVFVKVAAGGRVFPYLLAGGVMGLNTDARMSASPGSLHLTGDASPVVERWRWALALGAGIGATLTERLLVSVEGQYLLGLSNTMRGGTVEMSDGYIVSDMDLPTGVDYKSRGFRLQVGLSTPVW